MTALKDKAIPCILTFKNMSTPVNKTFEDLAQSKHQKVADGEDLYSTNCP